VRFGAQVRVGPLPHWNPQRLAGGGDQPAVDVQYPPISTASQPSRSASTSPALSERRRIERIARWQQRGRKRASAGQQVDVPGRHELCIARVLYAAVQSSSAQRHTSGLAQAPKQRREVLDRMRRKTAMRSCVLVFTEAS
jgi:hypothetical protein